MTSERRPRRIRCAWFTVTMGAVLLAGACNESPVGTQPPSNDETISTSGTTQPSSPTSAVGSPRPSSSAPRLANPEDYASHASRWPAWGFVTPSALWICVIATAPSGADRATCAANPGQGPLLVPGLPPAREDGGAGRILAPNAIEVYEAGGPWTRALESSIWADEIAPRTLPYGSVLQAGGFSCNAQPTVVSCREDSSGTGFSISTTGYRYRYTAVPAG